MLVRLKTGPDGRYFLMVSPYRLLIQHDFRGGLCPGAGFAPVMERASHIVTVPAEIGWDDVGSWAALPAIRQRDSAGNTVVGPTLIVDGTNNVVVSDDETLIATVGVSDLVVIKSGNAILVVPRDQAQDVRKVVEALAAPTLSRFR